MKLLVPLSSLSKDQLKELSKYIEVLFVSLNNPDYHSPHTIGTAFKILSEYFSDIKYQWSYPDKIMFDSLNMEIFISYGSYDYVFLRSSSLKEVIRLLANFPVFRKELVEFYFLCNEENDKFYSRLCLL